MNYIVTGLTEKYWKPWGASWLASLLELAETKSNIVIIDFGLKNCTKEKIKNHNVILFEAEKKHLGRNSALNTICKLAKEVDGNFVYYDADVWFQDKIDDVFDFIEDKILICENRNFGFIAGNQKSWQNYEIVNNITDAMKDEAKTECLLKYFDNSLKFIENKYNCINLSDLTDDKILKYRGNAIAALHPTGTLKRLLAKRHLFFAERYPDLFSKYIDEKKVGIPKRLFKKSKTNSESP